MGRYFRRSRFNLIGMRKIKFRAWLDGEMYPDVSTWTDDYTEMLNDTLSYFQEREDERMLLMQYTGLKDKKGKEIYEGDYLVTKWQHDGATNYDYEIRGGVEWDVERHQWAIKHDKHEGETWTYPLCSFEREELSPDDGIEVIGNIYENPELLEEANS